MPAHKIAYVLKRFPRFSETFILNELLAHEAAGAEVHVFSLLSAPKEQQHAKLEYLRAKVTMLKSFDKGRNSVPEPGDEVLYSGKTPVEIGALQDKADAVAKAVAAEGITHLHAHFGSDATTVACLAARAIGGSYSYTAHARDIYHTYVSPDADNAMRRFKLSRAAFVATVSDYNARHLRALCPEAKVVRLYNGIDLSAFQPVQPAQQAPASLIAVGRFVPKKGFNVLLNACQLLKADGVKFDLSLIGAGPLKDDLTNQITELDLTDCVSIEAPLPQEHLIQRIARAGVAVLPCVVSETGDRDGLPTVLLEAMACALPVVTTTVTGGPEIVKDGVTGKLCAPDDPVDLAAALKSVLSDPARARRMGLAGRIRAEARFDLTTNAARLRALLRDPSLAVREAA